MENILDEKPVGELNGRLLESVNFIIDSTVKGKRILDIGCGYGWCELELLKRGACSITGIEPSEKDLLTAKRHITCDNIDFRVANAMELPFENESFDTVVCWEVIEHLPENSEHALFVEVNRVLKAGGAFYLSTPYDSLVSKLLDPAWWLMSHRHYSKGKLLGYAEHNHFTVREVRANGGIWSLLAVVNMYISKWLLRRKALFQNFFTEKENREYEKGDGFATIFIHLEKHSCNRL